MDLSFVYLGFLLIILILVLILFRAKESYQPERTGSAADQSYMYNTYTGKYEKIS
jgi:hypothetical protein